MTENFVYVTGQDGEIYEVHPTNGLLNFLQRLAEEDAAGAKTTTRERETDKLRCVLSPQKRKTTASSPRVEQR